MNTIVVIGEEYYECTVDVAAGLVRLFASGEIRSIRKVGYYPETFIRPAVPDPIRFNVILGKKIEDEVPPSPVPQIEHDGALP